MISSTQTLASFSSVTMLTILATALLLGPASACYQMGCGRRRVLSDSDLSSALQMDDMMDMVQDCDNLSYTLVGSVTSTHLGFVAIPNQISQDCPILFLDDHDDGKKVTPMIDTPISLLEKFPKYEMGSFSLETILTAYHDATDSSGEDYDLMTNNCGTFVISMMEQLNVPVTMDHIAFAADHLLDEDTSGWITKTLRKHKLFGILFPRGDITPDLGLMYDFLAEYVDTHSQKN